MDTREKILETATRLFSAQGYGNTSLAQVAKEAEVSKALIFWHFENKDTLFRAVVQRTLEPYFINVLDELAELGPVEQIGRLIDEYYAFVSRHLDSVRFVLSLILRDEHRPADVIAHMDQLQRLYGRLLADAIERGQREGTVRPDVDPTLHARLLMSALYGVLVQRFLGSEPVPAPALLAHLKETFVASLARPAVAADPRSP